MAVSGGQPPPGSPVRVCVFPLLPRPIALLLLCLVCLQIAVPVRAAEWQYRVRPGDTLWDLAALHMKREVTWQQLQAHNRIADPYRLPPGTRLRFPVKWLRVQPRQAELVALRGEVTVRAGAGAAPLEARPGMRLGIGALLETGEDASATVQFADGSRTLVLSDSRIEFDRLSAFGATGMVDTRMRLQRGRASNQVQRARGPASRFIIQTPSATTSVRGTRFRVSADAGPASSTTEVIEGRVAVRTDGTQVELAEGFGTRAASAANPRPAPEALLPAPRFESPPAAAHGGTEIAWTPVPGAERYRVLAGLAQAPDVLAFERATRTPTLRLPPLPPGEYVVSVRGIAASGMEGLDAVHPIRALPGPPAPIALRVADADGRVVVPRPRFAWARLDEASGYRLQIARDEQFEDLVVDADAGAATRFRPARELAPGVYHWRVNARDADGNPGGYSPAERFEVIEPPPREVHIGDDERVLRWHGTEDGDRYRVQIARRQDFARPIVDATVDTPQLELDRLRGGRWYMRVQVIDDDGYAAPFEPPQAIELPCRWCKLGTGIAAGLLLLAL